MISAPAGLALPDFTEKRTGQRTRSLPAGNGLVRFTELQEPFRQYLLLQGVNPESAGRYLRRLWRFDGWCAYRERHLATLTPEDIKAYADSLRADGGTRYVVIDQMVAVRSFFDFLVERGVRAETPVYKPRRPAAPVIARPISEPWADGFRLWMLSRGYARATVRSSVYATLFFSRWCAEQSITAEQAQASDVSRFIVGELERTTQRAVSRKLSAIKNFYTFLVATGQRPDDPTESIKVKVPPLPEKEPLDAADLSRLLDAAGSVRNRALLLVFIRTGCRLGEVAEMRTEDIDWERGLLKVTGKGTKQRVVALGQEALGALREYLGDRTGTVWLGESPTGKGERLTRQGIYCFMRRAGKRAGVRVHPHKLRTSFACRFMDGSPDILALQILMGHSKIETTAHYARWGATRRALDRPDQDVSRGPAMKGTTLTAADEWAALRGEYLHYVVAQDRKQHTAERYANLAEMFLGWCVFRGIAFAQAGREDVAHYLADRRTDGAADSTIVNHAVAIRWLFGLLMARGECSDDPTRGIEIVRRKPRVLSVIETSSEPWRDSLPTWLLTHGRSRATVRRAVYTTLRYARSPEQGLDPALASGEDVSRFIGQELDRLAQSSASRTLTDLKALYGYLKATGQRSDDPSADLKIKPPRLQAQKPFTREEIDRLVAKAGTPRNRALVLTFAATGCRLAEVVGMTTEDVDWESGLLLVRGKGQRERYVALGERALDALRQYLAGRTGHIWLSDNIMRDGTKSLELGGAYFVLRRLGEQAGISGVYPHRFRTTFACRWMDASPDIQALQVLMGHSKIETTAHYAQWSAAKRALDTQRRLLAAGRLYGQEGVTNNGYETRQGEMSAPMDEGAIPTVSIPTNATSRR